MGEMRWTFDTDAAAFAGRVGPFLAARPERNLLATILMSICDGRFPVARAVLGTAVDDDGEVAAVALHTPAHQVVFSEIDAADADAAIDAWLDREHDLPGVYAVAPTARALAAAWARRTGGSTTVSVAMAYHQLQRVLDPPRPARGELRAATAAHRELAVDWWTAFAREAHVVPGNPGAAVDQRLRRRGLFLWEDDGEPVTLVAVNPAVAGVVRVGPVYTPPEHRSRGYASSAVAAVSRHALADGAHTCALFTDLANPTSNRIYADVGYRRTGDWEEIAFTPAD